LTDELLEPFTIDVEEATPRSVVVSVRGEIDISSSPALSRRLEALDGEAPFRVVVDLSRLTFIDSSGIRALILAARAIEARGGSVTLAAPQVHVARVFDTVHLAEVVAIEPSVEAALAR
jgi:anti-anti-sigma factor